MLVCLALLIPQAQAWSPSTESTEENYDDVDWCPIYRNPKGAQRYPHNALWISSVIQVITGLQRVNYINKHFAKKYLLEEYITQRDADGLCRYLAKSFKSSRKQVRRFCEFGRFKLGRLNVFARARNFGCDEQPQQSEESFETPNIVKPSESEVPYFSEQSAESIKPHQSSVSQSISEESESTPTTEESEEIEETEESEYEESEESESEESESEESESEESESEESESEESESEKSESESEESEESEESGTGGLVNPINACNNCESENCGDHYNFQLEQMCCLCIDGFDLQMQQDQYGDDLGFICTSIDNIEGHGRVDKKTEKKEKKAKKPKKAKKGKKNGKKKGKNGKKKGNKKGKKNNKGKKGNKGRKNNKGRRGNRKNKGKRSNRNNRGKKGNRNNNHY